MTTGRINQISTATLVVVVKGVSSSKTSIGCRSTIVTARERGETSLYSNPFNPSIAPFASQSDPTQSSLKSFHIRRLGTGRRLSLEDDYSGGAASKHEGSLSFRTAPPFHVSPKALKPFHLHPTHIHVPTCDSRIMIIAINSAFQPIPPALHR
jgi:hypothetical protein